MVQQMWNKYMPLSNESGCGLCRCDGTNVLGFKANVAIPQTSNFGVAQARPRLWRQVAFHDQLPLLQPDRVPPHSRWTSADSVPATRWACRRLSPTHPQQPWFLVAGLTRTCPTTWTNSIRYSYLRNWWQWGRYGGPAQFPGLGGALEPFGETRDPGAYSLQRQHAADPYPLLGRPGQHDSR